jgi:serine/threonine protein kinase
MKNEYIPILKLSLPNNTVSITGTNEPLICNPQLIGKGSFGKVYSTGEDEVYKKFKLITSSSNDFAIIENNIKEFSFYKLLMKKSEENSFTSSIFLPNVPSCISIPINIRFKNPFMFIDMTNYGKPLSKVEYTTFENFKYIFKQLVEGIQSLNSSNMSHGDLKPNNILIDSDNNVTIIDYGSICFFHSKHFKNKYQRCTIFYVSPEEIITGNYSLYNDWWSLGVIMFEFLTKKCFIKTLLETVKIKESIIQMFLDYSFELKSTEEFNPKKFLINAYLNLTEISIHSLIGDNIKDKELVYILKSLLTIDPQLRVKNKNKVLTFFDYVDITPRTIEVAGNLKEFSQYDFKHISIKTRNNIVYNTFKICIYYNEFGKEIIGHSIMLFDRFIFRLTSTNKNLYIYNMICIMLSNMLLKGESFKGNAIKKYIKECYELNITLNDIEEYVLEIIESLKYSLLCLPPDMLYNFEVDYSKMYNLYCKYPVINSYVYELYKQLSN